MKALLNYKNGLALELLISIITLYLLFHQKHTNTSYSKSSSANTLLTKDVYYNPDLNRNLAAPVSFDLKAIKKRGKLIALTGFSNSSYFIYKGTPMGYEYELLSMLAKDLKVDLQIVKVKDMNETFNMLNRGDGDIIADNLIVTKEHDKIVDFTVAVSNTRQMLVQRKPKNIKNLTYDQIEKKLIRNPINLIGKEVFVPKESAFFQRLQNLSEEVGGDIKIVEMSGGTNTEQMIGMVSKGEIDYSIIDENEALINRSHYKNIDMNTPVSFPQRIAWAVRENSPELQRYVNRWLLKTKNKPDFSNLYSKYYLNPKNSDKYVSYRLEQNKAGKISSYDPMISKYAKELGWDWRLLASLIYQESRFDPNAKSGMGAEGLMQLMPATAKNFGSINVNDPEENLKAGIAYIKWLDAYWKTKVPEKSERLKFIMASYNVGHAHITDAQRLAVKYKRNPKIWDGNVAYFVLQKANHKYWSDPVVKYGYCRGKETYDYVNNVLERYYHYKNLVKAIA